MSSTTAAADVASTATLYRRWTNVLPDHNWIMYSEKLLRQRLTKCSTIQWDTPVSFDVIQDAYSSYYVADFAVSWLSLFVNQSRATSHLVTRCMLLNDGWSIMWAGLMGTLKDNRGQQCSSLCLNLIVDHKCNVAYYSCRCAKYASVLERAFECTKTQVNS